MSVSKSRGGKPAVRPLLAGSLSVDGSNPHHQCAPPHSNSEPGGKKHRRHSATAGLATSKDGKEIDGSLKKVSKWFRDIKLKMDPIKVKDRIRYSRSSLATQVSVTEEDEEVFQGTGRTATLRPRQLGKRQLEKRFNSMECLPGSEPPPSVIRKMNSLQFEAENGSDGMEKVKDAQANTTSSNQHLETAEQDAVAMSRSSGVTAHFDRLTEEIDRNLDEKEKLLKEIIFSPSTNFLDQDSNSDPRGSTNHRRCSSKVKADLLESAYLANELTRQVNESIRPEHLFTRHQSPEATETENEFGETPNYVRVSSKLSDVIDRLQNQLTSLLGAFDRNSNEMERLRDDLEVIRLTPGSRSRLTLGDDDHTNAQTHRRYLKQSSSSSVSDTECFLSLIRDLNEIN